MHQFQGLEVDIIIFDIVEGPMPHYGPPPFLTGEELTSEAARLINVAITRPKAQLVVIAHYQYLRVKLSPNSILYRLLTHMREHGEVGNARDIVGGYSFHVQHEFQPWHPRLVSYDNLPTLVASAPYTQRDFYPALFADLKRAQREIIIVSPFATERRTQDFLELFRRKVVDGVIIRVFVQAREQQSNCMRQQAEAVFNLLRDVSVETVERPYMHHKFAIIDLRIAWEGSLNILSHRSTIEHIRRLGDWQMLVTRTCEELVAVHSLGSNAQIASRPQLLGVQNHFAQPTVQ